MRLANVLAYAASIPRFHVYAVCDHGGVPVYIGSSERPETRAHAHQAGNWEILDSYPTKRMMLDAEREYIEYLRPVLNHRYVDVPAVWPLND